MVKLGGIINHDCEFLLVGRHAQFGLLTEPFRRILLLLALGPLTVEFLRMKALLGPCVIVFQLIISFTGPLRELFSLNLDFLHFDRLLDIGRFNEGLAHDIAALLFLLLLSLPLVKEGVLLGHVAPRLEAGLVEHLGEEKIDWHGLVLLEIELFKRSAGHFLEHFVLESDLCNAILGHQLLNCHDFVEFQANSGHKLSSHDTVEHLVEVDKPIVDVDAHLQNNPVDFFLPGDFTHANPRLHPGRQCHEELWNLLGLHLDA